MGAGHKGKKHFMSSGHTAGKKNLALRVLENAMAKAELKLKINPLQIVVKAIENKPALILLDIMMPKMDGFEVLKSLKGNNNTKDIPVVVLTNLAGQQDAERALTMGAKKYIIKSEQDPKEVAKMVKMTLDEIKVDTSES